MPHIGDFPSLEEYIQFRIKENARKRRWQARNPDKVRCYRAAYNVLRLNQSITRQCERQAELYALLELDEGTLLFVHDTCSHNLRIELQRLEERIEQTRQCLEAAITKLEEIEK